MSHVTLGVTVCLITNTEKKDYERVRPGSLQKINPDYSSSFSTEERPGSLQKVNPNFISYSVLPSLQKEIETMAWSFLFLSFKKAI